MHCFLTGDKQNHARYKIFISSTLIKEQKTFTLLTKILFLADIQKT